VRDLFISGGIRGMRKRWVERAACLRDGPVGSITGAV
jgi:hypothetical protein